MYEQLTTLAPDLHVFQTRGSKGLGRVMTVMGLPGGRLAIHSAIDLDEPARLDALGKVAFILVGNRMHTIEAPVLAERYPEAAVLAPRAVAPKLKLRTPASDAESAWPGELDSALACVPLGGTRLNEVAYIHRSSRTLVLCDLAFHFRTEDFQGFMRSGMAFNESLGPMGPTRLFRTVLVGDQAAFRGSLARLFEEDFDRVIVSHGHVLESGGKEVLRTSFARWL